MDSTAHPPQGLSHAPPLAFFLKLYGLIVMGLLVHATASAASRPQTFHIEAGEAILTLTEFSRQSSLQLLYDYGTVQGRTTRAVQGELDPATALRRMLADTDLVFDFVNDRTLAITQLNRDPGAGSAVADAAAHPVRPHPAETQSVKHEGSGSNDLTGDPKTPEMEEVRVTGTHVRGEEPVGERVLSYDREEISQSGAATVQDFLRTLPQTFGGGPTQDTMLGPEAQSNSGIGVGINLRGLGARSTLVLINGKRLAPSGSDAAFADIGTIPLSAVERMDVLPDSASALYGADAVGGVVNFVMRDNFVGSDTLVRGGSGTKNTLGEYQAAQTIGSRWDSGNAMVSVEFYRRDALPASARRYGTSNLTSLGGNNFDTLLSNPGNIIVGGKNYAIPYGQDGTALTASDLVAGTQNLTNKLAGYDLLPSQRRLSLYSSGRQELTDTVHLFANAMLSQREAKRRNPGVATTLTVTNSNPFYVNPTGGTGPISVDYNFTDDLGLLSADSQVTNTNVTLGLDLDVGRAWKLTLYGNYAQDKENQFTAGQLNTAAVQAALLDSNPATAFNPFGDGSHTNPATLASIATSSRFYTNSKLRSADLTADGPIATVPGGAIKLALGVDHRNQVFDSRTTESPLLNASLSRNVTAAFAEMTVPVFGKENGAAGYRRLELSVAGRYENYNQFAHATTPKAGLIWSPLEAVAFRGTWGRSIRAPTLSDLNTRNNIVASYILPDSTSPTGLLPVLLETGNTPNLRIEQARSWTAGFDFEPRNLIAGLTFSATYFDINFTDRIQQPVVGAGVLNDPALANLVFRNPDPALRESACSQGQFVAAAGGSCLTYPALAIVDLRSQNLQSVRTQGIDFNTTYEHTWSAGTLRLGLDGTWLFHFTQQEGPDSPAAQLLNTQTNPIDLKMRANLNWQQRRWGATLGINFQNNYTDTASQPHHNIRSYTTFDTQLRYDLAPYSAGPLQNTRVELNAINLFNVSPPFLNNKLAGLGYDEENADPYGRMLSLQVRKIW